MKLKTTTITLCAAAAVAGVTIAADEGGRPSGPPAEVIAKYDKDGDGKLNEAERAEARKNRPARPDGEAKPGDDDKAKGKGKGGDGKGKGGDGKGKGGDGKGKGGGEELFNRADKNSDGKLTEDELPAEAWARLSKADKDGDGSISKAEIAAARGSGAGGGTPGNGERLKEMDKNGDGNLSKDEVPERAWQFLSRADKNGDDVLSKGELEAMRAAAGDRGNRGDKGGKGGKGGGSPADMFANLDKDKDGKLTEAEVPEQLWSRLSKADTDADGAVSKAELEATQAAGKSGTKPGQSTEGKPKRPKIES